MKKVVSGMISDYNKPFEEKYGVRNLQVMFEKRLKMQGVSLQVFVLPWDILMIDDRLL